MNKSLPLYEITLENELSGVFGVSLVDYPAIEVNYLYFNSETNTNFKLSNNSNNEQMIITGVALIPDKPIYRIGPNGEEFNIVFRKDTIEQIVTRFFKDSNQLNVNLMHNDKLATDKLILFESYLVNKERGIEPKEFVDLPDGSWVVSYKCTDIEFWNQLKNSDLRGFSVEVNCDINKVENKIKNNKMSFINKLRSLVTNLGSIESDKGLIEYIGDELVEGIEVYQNDEVLADGEYKIEGFGTISVESGIVSKVSKDSKDSEEESKEVEDPEVKLEDTKVEDTKVEDTKVEDPSIEPQPQPNPTQNLDPIFVEIDSLKSCIDELINRISVLESTPASDNVVEEFKSIAKKGTNRDPKLARIQQMFNN